MDLGLVCGCVARWKKYIEKIRGRVQKEKPQRDKKQVFLSLWFFKGIERISILTSQHTITKTI